MKNSLLAALVAATIGVSASANAAFVEEYGVGNWTTSISSGGGVTTIGAPFAVTLVGANNWSGNINSVDVTTTAVGTGWVTFDWLFGSLDFRGPSYDPFGFLLNGAFTQVTSNGGSNVQSGSASFMVEAGDVFGFSQRSLDNQWGRAMAIVSNFNAPAASVTAVPEPATLALLGLGMLGLGAVRRRAA